MAIQAPGGAAAHGQPIGFVIALSGSATAQGRDGVMRDLQMGAPVFSDDVINTDTTGGVSIGFVDGTRMDLGRESQAMLDADVFDPSTAVDTAAAAASVEAMQAAILAGEDPTRVFEAAAAGVPGEEAAGGGHDAVFIERTAEQTEPTSGFETTGIAIALPPVPDAVLTATEAPTEPPTEAPTEPPQPSTEPPTAADRDAAVCRRGGHPAHQHERGGPVFAPQGDRGGWR